MQLFNKHVQLRKVIPLNIFRRIRVYNNVGNHIQVFSTWRTRTGSSDMSQCTSHSWIM